MKGVQFSLAAEADLEAIDDYTIREFGLQQAIRTAETFRQACIDLVRFPRGGSLSEERSPPGRAFRFRTVLSSFVIVYEPCETGIRIARILHGARHLQAELQRNPGDEMGA